VCAKPAHKTLMKLNPAAQSAKIDEQALIVRFTLAETINQLVIPIDNMSGPPKRPIAPT